MCEPPRRPQQTAAPQPRPGWVTALTRPVNEPHLPRAGLRRLKSDTPLPTPPSAGRSGQGAEEWNGVTAEQKQPPTPCEEPPYNLPRFGLPSPTALPLPACTARRCLAPIPPREPAVPTNESALLGVRLPLPPNLKLGARRCTNKARGDKRPFGDSCPIALSPCPDSPERHREGQPIRARPRAPQPMGALGRAAGRRGKPAAERGGGSERGSASRLPADGAAGIPLPASCPRPPGLALLPFHSNGGGGGRAGAAAVLPSPG